MNRSRVGRFAANAASAASSDLVNRFSTFVIYALVGRYLGAVAFGQLSLALTFFYTGQVVATAGLRLLLVREATRFPDRINSYYGNASAVAAVMSLAGIAVTALLVVVLGYSRDTAEVILLVAPGVLPYALGTVCEGMLQARERMLFIAAATAPVNAIKIVLAYLLLTRGHPLWQLTLILLFSYVAVTALESIFVRRVLRVRHRFDRRGAVQLARASSTFFGVEGLVAVSASINVVLLSLFASEREVGLYSAAVQFLIPMTVLANSLMLSAFPELCRRFQFNTERLSAAASAFMLLLSAVAVPMALVLGVLARPAIRLLYGPDLEGAAATLTLLSGSIVLVGLTAVLGHTLYAGLQERRNLQIVVIDSVAAIALGFILISAFGAVGAAVALLAVKALDFGLHASRAKALIPEVRLVQLLWRPLVAAAAGAGAMIAESADPAHARLALGIGTYLVVWLSLELMGPHPALFRVSGPNRISGG